MRRKFAYRRACVCFVFCGIAGSSTQGDQANDPDRFGAIRGLEKADVLPPHIESQYVPWEGETITLLGGTSVVEQQTANYFEAMATVVWSDKDLRFRNLAWQADTVYRQQRPLYFFDGDNSDDRAGSTPDQRQKVEAGTVLVRFGKMESLEGLQAIPKFRDAYARMLDQLLTLTPRVIVLTPTPFYLTGPAAELARKRNEVLEAYAHAIRTLASEKGLHVVDLLRRVPAEAESSENGIHPNDKGQRLVAEAILEGLSPEASAVTLGTPSFEKLRERIRYKNSIWLQYYRPTNWSFLYGDRQHVPSSRDHLDREKRWFPFEIESALSLIEQEEKAIFEMAKEVGGAE